MRTENNGWRVNCRLSVKDFLVKDNRQSSKINVLDSKIEVLKSEMRSGFSALGAALENAVLRGELSPTREIADLRIRVERLESERGQLAQ